MAAKKAKSSGLSTTQKVGIGVGITAAAVAAAGAYFLYGSKDAKKNRAKVRSWVLKAKAEVLEALEKAEEMTQDEYEKLVETVSGVYATVKDISKTDLLAFKKEMKAHWPKIAKESKSGRPAAKKTVKKVAKKVAAQTTKNASKKAMG